MSETFTQFEQRLNSLERKHKELANGYVAKINPDGLITIAPKDPRATLRTRLGIAIILGFLLFKTVTMALVGPVTYESRLDVLRDGTGPERFGAFIMQVDPITGPVAEYLRGVIN